MSLSSCFPAVFTKGNNFHNFLLAFLDNLALSKWDLLLKEILTFKCRREAKMKMVELLPQKVYLFTLNYFHTILFL